MRRRLYVATGIHDGDGDAVANGTPQIVLAGEHDERRPSRYVPASACRPMSVIVIQVTSIGRVHDPRRRRSEPVQHQAPQGLDREVRRHHDRLGAARRIVAFSFDNVPAIVAERPA
jgi:hypothetical protein